MKSTSIFQHRRVLLVTRHGKQKVIAPLLQEAMNITMDVSENIDTDEFGTFSGDVERPADQYTTAKLKALRGLERNPAFEIAIASEGAFNPHPDSPFITVNTEIVLLMDRRHDLEITGRYVSIASHVSEKTVTNINEALETATAIGFPETGVILKAIQRSNEAFYVLKDFQSVYELSEAASFLFNNPKFNSVIMQTDMRAHRNPQRMENIRIATAELINNMLSECPACRTPGFTVTDVKRGLPCEWCGTPTQSILAYHYECSKCRHAEEKMFPKGKLKEDPGYCQRCNP
jgi:hypothetical protein